MQSGDITCSDQEGELLIKSWSIEIKTGYGIKKKKEEKTEIVRWDVLDFLDSTQKKPVLQKMWNQCKRDADLTNKIPVLIFRRNNRTPCICFTDKYFYVLLDFFGGQCPVYICSMNLVILSLTDFFEWIVDIRPALFLHSRIEQKKPVLLKKQQKLFT